MKVRRFQPGDEMFLAEIFNLAFKSYIETIPEVYDYRPIKADSLLDPVECSDSDIWVVETAEQVVGFAQCEVVLEEGVNTLWLKVRPKDLGQSTVAIEPEYQRRGFGTFLVREIIEHYERVGAKVVVAMVYDDNLAGERFFQGLGFAHYDVFQLKTRSRPIANSTTCERVSLKDEFEVPTSNLDVRFREANISDAWPIAYIHEKNVWWCDECSTIEWSQKYINGEFGHRVMVAECNDRVIGIADYIRSNGKIGIGGVLPEYRGQGVGSALFATLLNAMRTDGFETAFVDSGLTQEEAIRMYERFGFQTERRQNCWIMVLPTDLE